VKIAVQFPLRTKSENVLRSLPFAIANVPATKRMGMAMAIAGGVKKQRAQVRLMLDSQLVKPGGSSFYLVTLIRISAGELDDDGLAGALKNVRDEVAAWLGIDDGPRAHASWRYGQQRGPRGTYAVRIEIEVDDGDYREFRRVVGPTIAKLGPVVGNVDHAR
jgi:hypothetical protein